MKKRQKALPPKSVVRDDDAHRLHLVLERMKEDTLIYTTNDGTPHLVELDHSRCTPLR